MRIVKILGTETEYGINLPHTETRILDLHKIISYMIGAAALSFDSFSGKEEINGSIPEQIAKMFDWPLFLIERLFERTKNDLSEVLRIIGGSGEFLSNGSRFYDDSGHPEYSTPECTNAYDLLVHEKAGERIVEDVRRSVEKKLGIVIDIHKDNSDRKGNSYAAHENYMVTPRLFNLLTDESIGMGNNCFLNAWVNFLVTRQIWAGSGKVGSDLGNFSIGFQIAQRSEFIRKKSSLDTMEKRGIVNTRDICYSDPTRNRRLHVIIGDGNMCEVAILLKVGVSSLFLKILETDFLERIDTFLKFENKCPVSSVIRISRDPFCPFLLLGEDNRNALDVQKEVLRVLELFCNSEYSPDSSEQRVMEMFRKIIGLYEDDPKKLYGMVDHITKKIVIERQLKRKGKAWSDPLALYLDFLYHSTNVDKSLFYALFRRGDIVRVAGEDDVKRAILEPPKDTRAFLRGKIIEKFKRYIFSGTWRNLSVVGNDTRFNIIMNDLTMKGENEAILGILNESASVGEFIEKLRRLP